ncbi:MAG: hypothetical protein KGJ78_07800 [Alphaproteobacteria bacterium]|nr:hypothetical protein [Alphaproteobacteria bacterium]
MTIQRFAAALLCVLLAGCLPVTSKTPVGTTTGLGADPALFGTWKGHGPESNSTGDVYLHFVQDKNGPFVAVMVGAPQGVGGGWMAFDVRTSQLANNRYLNAVMTYSDNKPADGTMKDASFPLRYTLKGRTLTLYMLDEDKIKAAIQSGKIAGTVEPGDFGDVKITADAKELDAFFAAPESAQLFKVYMVLKRVE